MTADSPPSSASPADPGPPGDRGPRAAPPPDPRAARLPDPRAARLPQPRAARRPRLRAARLPWPLRSVVAGAAGTTAMTSAYALERRLRPRARGPLDYDDSLVPGRIVASIMHLPQASDREEQELGLALRWGYGSAFGLLHGVLRRRVREPGAGLVFVGVLMTMTLTMFPLLGRTPPPWRWPRAFLATSFATHAVYAATVAGLDDRLR